MDVNSTCLGFHKSVISTVVVVLGMGTAWAAEAPVIPTGSDAYRMWDRWANQRIGVRAYMRSTYDRQGGNERADAAHFLYQLAPDYNVTLDLQGRGILYFVRYNHWHGSPWHYDVDGKKFTVTETSTPDPLHPAPNSVFEPSGIPEAPDVYLGRYQGRRLVLGSCRVQPVISNGLLAHLLRNRLLHLSPVRRRD